MTKATHTVSTAMRDEFSKELSKDKQSKEETQKYGALKNSHEGLMILNFLLDSANEPNTEEGKRALTRTKTIIWRLSTKQCMQALLRTDRIPHRAFGSQPARRIATRSRLAVGKPIWQQEGMGSKGLNHDQICLLEEVWKLTRPGMGLIKVTFPETKRTLVHFELSLSQTKSDFCCEPPVNSRGRKLRHEWDCYDLRREAAKEIRRMAQELDIVCPSCNKQVGKTHFPRGKRETL